MNKTILSLGTKHGYVNIIWGCGFLILTVAELFCNVNGMLVGSITNLLCSSFVIISLLMKSETDDERSIRNLERAGQHALLLTIIFLAFLNCVFVTFENIVVSPLVILHAIIGCTTLLYGFFFLWYEKEGC